MKFTESVILISTQNTRKKFRGKCVRCRRPTQTVHEIIPKSLRPTDWWEEDNRVLLCIKCHNDAHRFGAVNFAPILIKLRDQRLEEYASTINAEKS